jgi:hypothetical protein
MRMGEKKTVIIETIFCFLDVPIKFWVNSPKSREKVSKFIQKYVIN